MNKFELKEFALNNGITLYYSDFKRQQEEKTYTMSTADHPYLKIIEQVIYIEKQLNLFPYRKLTEDIQKEIYGLDLEWTYKYEIMQLTKMLQLPQTATYNNWFEVILNQNKIIEQFDFRRSNLFNLTYFDYVDNKLPLMSAILDIIQQKLHKYFKNFARYEKLLNLIQTAADAIEKLIIKAENQTNYKQILIKVGTDFHRMLDNNAHANHFNLTDFNQFPIYEIEIYYNGISIGQANIGLFSRKKQLLIDKINSQQFNNPMVPLAKMATCVVFMSQVGLNCDFNKFYSCYETLDTFKSNTRTTTNPAHGFYNNLFNCSNKSPVLLYASKQTKPQNNKPHFVYVFDSVCD